MSKPNEQIYLHPNDGEWTWCNDSCPGVGMDTGRELTYIRSDANTTEPYSIDDEFKKFIEFPTEDHSFVTTTSAILFAEHWHRLNSQKLIAENERLKNLAHKNAT